MKKTRLYVIAMLLVTALIVIGMCFGYAKLTKLQFHAEHTKAMLSGQIGGQAILFDKLVEILESFDELDKAVTMRVQSVYQTVAAGEESYGTLLVAMDEVKAAAQSIPTLVNHSLYQQLMDEIQLNSAQIQTYQEEFEQAGNAYQSYRGGLWGIMIGSLFGFPAADTYIQ